MASSYLTNIHTRTIITENMIFHNVYMSKYVQSKKKNVSFPLRISPVNVTKSTVSCGFGHIY